MDSDNNNTNNNNQPPPPPSEDSNSSHSTNITTNDPQNSSFVVFQLAGGASESVVFNLPHALRSGPTPGNAGQAQHQPPSMTADPSENTSNTDQSDIQRNMYVSVTYMYSQIQQPPDPATNQNDNTQPEGAARTGTILLAVPNIPNNRTETQIHQLVEFAASIALSAIAAHGLARLQGIKMETFEKFKVLERDEVHDSTCSICFEDFVLESEKTKANETETEMDEKIGEKRKRDGESDDQAKRPAKKARLSHENEDATHNDPPPSSSSLLPNTTSSPNRSLSNLNPSSTSESEPKYEHVPIILPCNHVFGRDCLYEWLKTKNSCPLCRKVVHQDANQATIPQRLNVPNIESFLSPTTRDRPMIIDFNRDTSTLTAIQPRQSTNETEQDIEGGSQNVVQPRMINPLRSLGVLRNEEVRNELQNINNINTDALFPSGVMSRRRSDGGVDTMNNTRAMPSLSESSRLLRERIIQRLNERRDSILESLRGRNTSNNNNQQENNATQEEVNELNQVGSITENNSNDDSSSPSNDNNRANDQQS